MSLCQAYAAARHIHGAIHMTTFLLIWLIFVVIKYSLRS